MERSEPTLIPEWLKGGGSINGSSTSHRTLSSSLHSDDHVASKSSRNKSSVGTNGQDTGRTFVSDRTTSSYFRRSSSSNGSSHFRSHGSFGRSNRDKEWERDIHNSRDKEKSILGDHGFSEYSDPLENILPSRFDKDLRRSQSMINGKRGKSWPKNVHFDYSNANKSNPMSSFERDFPSLGVEERQTALEIRRVSSPGLSSAIKSLPVASSAVARGDGWTSALAEGPVLVGSNDTVRSVQQAIPPTSASLASSTVTGMNMAETLVQGPSRPHTPPQLSAGTQRLEELAIKQSRQLIPMTPSVPKALVLNSSSKPKPKLGLHQHQHQHQILSSHLTNHSPPSGPMKSDISRTTSVGKLHVLKPASERNVVSPTVKDSLSPTAVGSAPLRSPSNNPPKVLEKKSTPQSQSRNDFFNLMRRKSMTCPSSPGPGPGLSMSSSDVSDKSDETETGSAPVMPEDGDSPSPDGFFEVQRSEKRNDVNCNGIASNGSLESLKYKHQEEHMINGKVHLISNGMLCSEEEEAAFLRSLGWEENGGEEEGLTEEEISSFYKEVDEYIKSRPSSRVSQGTQPKFLVPLNLRMKGVGGGASSGSISSDAESES